MNILLITTGLGLGGAERQVIDLADSYVRRGHDVSIISLTGDSILKPNESKIVINEIKMKKSFFGFLLSLYKVKKIIENNSPDVIHSHQYHANIFTRILRLIFPFNKLICTAHSNNEGGAIRMLSYRITDSLADITTNVSEDAVNCFINKKASAKGRIICIPNGIDVNKFQYSDIERDKKRQELLIDDNTYLFMAVGRLDIPKDYPNLLKAFSLLISRYKNARLAILGSGPLENELKSLTVTLNIKENVMFLGARNNVQEWLSAADTFVLSSEWEGFGLVIAEAMLAERYIVATDCGGVKNIVGELGDIVPPKDSILLYQKMLCSINAKNRKDLGIASRKRIIDKFSLTTITDKWLDIYTEK